MKRGKYELKKRAERQEETRLRIARATLELHEILGPALTTRSAIAERAGVTRPTVYSHFPDELTLGKACSSLELSDNPLPDPGPWGEIADPERRMRVALMVANPPNHHHASPSPGSSAKIRLTASSASAPLTVDSFWAWSSLDDIVPFPFPSTVHNHFTIV